jgi:hypothetical protein
MRRIHSVAIALLFLAPLTSLPGASADAAPQSAPQPLASASVTVVDTMSYGGRISQVAYSPDGRYLAVAVIDGPVLVLNATTHAEVFNFTTPPLWVSVSSLSWGPKSDKVGVGYQGGAVAVWRVPGGTNAWAKSGIFYDIRGVSWSPDGRYLAAGYVHSINIYWGEDGTLNSTFSLDYGGSQPAGLSWSHDSDYIAVGEQAYSPRGAIVAVFEARTWTKALTYRWNGPGMDLVAFEGRARFLAVQLGLSRMEVWEVRNWSQYANISTLSGVEQFAWTADGSRMVMLETEPVARPNETEDFGGFEVLHLGGGANNSSSMGVSPDGRRVAIGYWDGTLRVLAIAEDRLFDDRTPIVATTGDPLGFDVRATAPGAVDVAYADSSGSFATRATLSAAGDRHTLTVTVPSNLTGLLFYHFEQAATGLRSPVRVVRVSDNDPPTLANWTFDRQGGAGEVVSATATISDNIRLLTATFQLAVDGTVIASATSGANQTIYFALGAPITSQNRSVRLDAFGVDDAGNGGPLFDITIPLVDMAKPAFGADVSESGTAGGRIKLGTVATDDRGAPVVSVTYRELKELTNLDWQTVVLGAPAPGSTAFFGTFPMGRDTVAVEYSFHAADAQGNAADTEVRVQRVFDREPPEIVADLTDRQATLGDPLHLAVLVRDNIGIASVDAFVQADGGAQEMVALTPWPAGGAGAYEGNRTVGAGELEILYSFLVSDVEGNSVASGSKRLRVGDNDPPVISILNPGRKIVAGQPYTLQVHLVDASPVGGVTIFYQRLGDSAFFTEDFLATTPGRNLTILIPFADLNITTRGDPRPIRAYLYARDSTLNAGYLGSRESPLIFDVVDGLPPRAAFEVLGVLQVGSIISFDGSISTDDLGIAAFAWTVDGADAGNGTSLEWHFATAGDHVVRLTVTDVAGKTHASTQTLTIQPPPAVPIGVGGSADLLLIVVAAAAAGIVAVLLLMRRRNPPQDGAP